MNTFSIKEAFGFGWQTFKKRPWFFISIPLVAVLVSILTSTAAAILDVVFQGVASAVIPPLTGVLIGAGIISVYLKAYADVTSPTLKDLWRPELFVNILVVSILMWVVITVGFILLIIPGVILSLMLGFAPYRVVDKNIGPIEALKESYRLTKGSLWRLFLFCLVFSLLNLVGALLLILGLFVTVPVSLLALVYVYRALEKNHSVDAPVIA